MKHIVLYSGGIGSWSAAKRVTDKVGFENVILLFTDTKTEDADLYRFLEEGAAALNVPLTKIADGRDIWQVFKDVRYMGNSRRDPCSLHLKRSLADKWIKKHFTPAECVCYVGIDWSEVARFDRMAPRKLPYIYKAPLTEAPYLTKAEMLKQLSDFNIRPPKLYEMGFPHNNCGGFCVRAGQAHFKLLYEQKPDYYRECERKEESVYEHIGKKNPFLRIVQNGVKHYVTLREFRHFFLEGDGQVDLDDYGGCGCFLEDYDADRPK